MVKVRYLGPDPMFRQRLRNSWRDAADQLSKVRPLGPEYRAIERCCHEIAALYEAVYGESLAPPKDNHTAGNGARGNSPP